MQIVRKIRVISTNLRYLLTGPRSRAEGEREDGGMNGPKGGRGEQ